MRSIGKNGRILELQDFHFIRRNEVLKEGRGATETYRACVKRPILEGVSIVDLAIAQVLGIGPDDYMVGAMQAVVAKHLGKAGMRVAPVLMIEHIRQHVAHPRSSSIIWLKSALS